jgi:SAM-dependent methyltransferase
MRDWFKTSLGQWLVAEEMARCEKLVPAGYYPTALQIGLSQHNYLAGIEIGERFLTVIQGDDSSESESSDPDLTEKIHRVTAEPMALPFSDKTHSLIVVPHVLDYCKDPHAVLREVNQILIPEGCVVISGFNQVSLWGAAKLGGKRLSAQRYNNAPWRGHYYRVKRVQDWLSLLGFDIVGASMFAYQPPLQSEKWRSKLSFIDKIGDRWWPSFGAGYMIVGKKREIASSAGGTRRAWRRFIPAMARPAVSATGDMTSSGTHGKNHLRLVVKN